jgi:hypothetical protein
MTGIEKRPRQWRWLGVAALAVLSLVRPAAAFDPDATFARGTTIFGLQIGGGAVNNVEGHRRVSDISFINESPRVSHLFFSPFGSGLLRSAFEPGLEGWFQQYLSPHSATAEGLKLTGRYHLIGFGRFVPYLEGTAGAGGTIHVRARGRRRPLLLRHRYGRDERGLSLPAHLERGHLQAQPGLQLGFGGGGHLVLLQVRCRAS